MMFKSIHMGGSWELLQVRPQCDAQDHACRRQSESLQEHQERLQCDAQNACRRKLESLQEREKRGILGHKR